MKFSELSPTDGQRISVAGRTLVFKGGCYMSGEEVVSEEIISFLQDAEAELIVPVGACLMADTIDESLIGRKVSVQFEGIIDNIDPGDSRPVSVTVDGVEISRWIPYSAVVTLLD